MPLCGFKARTGAPPKENAAAITALYVDGDGAQVPANLPRPTAIVRSSPGREQFYWRLSMPVPPEVGEDLNRRMAYAMKADKSGWDLTQLLRPPGTKNIKYPETPVVEVEDLETNNHDAGELDRLLPPLPEVFKNGHRGKETTNEPPVELGPAALRVWRGEKPKTKDTGEIDRSASLMKIGRVLYDAGVSPRVVAEALKERDLTLGYEKYTNRRDANEQYQIIADKLEQEGRNQNIPINLNGSSHKTTEKTAKPTPKTRASITAKPTVSAVTRPIRHAPEKMVLTIIPSFLQDGFFTTVRVLRRGRRRGCAAQPHRRRLFTLTGL
jgi:hypothetical protein